MAPPLRQRAQYSLIGRRLHALCDAGLAAAIALPLPQFRDLQD
jgi:hypothetical protein